MKTTVTTWLHQNGLAYLAAILLAFLMYANPVLAVQQKNELMILNWSEYMDPELIKKFEQRYKVKVHEVYFETDQTRDEMLLATNGGGYDIILSNETSLQSYVKRGWLEPLDTKKIPNLKYINPKWRDSVANAKKYAVPYFWGTIGIAYREDKIPMEITSWKQFFEPPKAAQGKVVTIKYARDAIGMALKAHGYSVNSEKPEELKQAEALLMQQKPYVKSYGYVALDEKSGLVNGEVLMAMMYNGDAMMVKEHNPSIKYVVPKEGSNLWVDYLSVAKLAKNKKLAWQFINFLNEPKNAAQLAEFVYYASPNLAAEKLLPKEFKADPVIYPSKAVLKRSEYYKILSPRTVKRHNTIFRRVVE